MNYTLTELTAPIAEPLPLSLVKSHLAIGHDDDDVKLTRDIAAAREYAEAHTGVYFGERTFLLKLSAWPDDAVVRLPVEPISSVDEVRYKDADAVSQIVAASDYRLWLEHSPPLLRFTTNFAYPSIDLEDPAGIEIEFTGGLSVIPERLVKALEIIIEYWYANPGGEDTLGHLARGIPSAADRLLDTLWTGGLGC